MRLRNFCVQMGFALFVALILILFVHNIPLAILYVIGHLIWALVNDRRYVRGEIVRKALEEKYPARAMPDTQYTVGDRTVTLKDDFVKAALLKTISYTYYESKKQKDKTRLEQFYSAVMTGEYTLQPWEVTKIEYHPGNDSPDEYYVYSGSRRVAILETKQCKIGDCLVEVTVKNMPYSAATIWLDAENEQQAVVSQITFAPS